MTGVAVIGCGHWGPNHIRTFSNMPGVRVVGAADIDSSRLERVSTMFPGLEVARDYHALLEDPSVNAVVITTPTSTHYEIALASLRAGKHVLCEKPLCESAEQGRELIDLAHERKLLLMVGHVFLFNAGIIKLKEVIESGELGSVHYASAVRTNLGPIRRDVNAAYDLAAHDISIFNWLFDGEAEQVSATGGCFLQPGIEDVVFITLRYPGNVVANVHASWLNPKKVRQITVVGAQKMVTWDDLELSTPVALYDRGANAKQEYADFGEFLRIAMWDGDVRLPKVQLDEPLRVQNRYFLECLRDRPQKVRSNGAFSLGVVRTIEAALHSMRNGGAPVMTR